MKKFLKKNVEEFFSKKFWRDVACELVATFFLVSVQCAISIPWSHKEEWSIVQYALGLGFTVTVLTEAFAPLGGAHMNPAVTLGLAAAGEITLSRVFLYIVAQCGGSIGGAAFVYGITPPHERGNLGIMTLHPEITVGQGVVTEAWLTFMLMQTVWGATNSRRRRVLSPSIPIGLAYTVNIFAGFSYTGANANPVRALGPAVMSNSWNNHWIYWAGPISGAVVATIVYHFVLNHIAIAELPMDYEKEELRSVLRDSSGRRSSSNGIGRYQQIYGLNPRSSNLSTISS